MISHKKKFIIITPQKTASTTISHALLEYGNIQYIKKQGSADLFDYADEFSPLSKHTSISIIKQKWNSSINFDEYLLIGTIRNPYDRWVSWWNHGPSRNNEFKDYMYSKLVNSPNKEHNILINFFSHKKEILVKNYIRFENLQDDFDMTCAKMGIPQKELLHKNKSAHKPYWEYYDNEIRELVATKCKKDIKYFGYEFGK